MCPRIGFAHRPLCARMVSKQGARSKSKQNRVPRIGGTHRAKKAAHRGLFKIEEGERRREGAGRRREDVGRRSERPGAPT